MDRVRGRRAGLFLKYFGFIGLLVSVGLVASGAIGLYFSYQETRDALVSLQREKALTAAVRIEQFLRDIESQLGWTALPLVTPGQGPMEHRRLDYLKLIRQAPAITEVSYLDANGREQLKVSRLAMDTAGSNIDFSKDPRFVEARKGKTWFGPVYFRRETEPYMTISIPEAPDRPGVTAVDVNLKFIWDVVSRIRIGEKGLAYVVDDKGFLVAHPDISLVLKKVNLSDLPQVKAALAAGPDAEFREAADARDPGGVRVFSAYSRVTPTGWRVFVEEPVAEVFTPLYDAILRTSLLLVAGMVLSMIASVFLARRMVRPVRALQQGADRIGRGDLASRIEVKTGDELEDLAGRFNTMTEQLRESYANLEKKVQDRTEELRETLDQQTATADVLKVISRSTTDVMPVFEAIVRSAMKLGDAVAAAAFRYDGQGIHYVTSIGTSEEGKARMRADSPKPVNRHSLSGRVILDEAVVQITDNLDDPEYDRETARVSPGRRLLGVPMLRDGVPIGTLNVVWKEPGVTPEKYVRMLQTFADQAVIAIENVRLFNETKESLEQQTSTAEVLKVISRSTTDVLPVFEAIVRSARDLCEASHAYAFRFDGGEMHYVASTDSRPESLEFFRKNWVPDTSTLSGRVALGKKMLVVEDVAADPDYNPHVKGFIERRGLGVPMLREGSLVGVLVVNWTEPGPVSDKAKRVLQTFADQAVIAIENVRLFNETKESLEHQIALADILRVISNSPTDTQPVLDAIAANATRVAGAEDAGVLLVQGNEAVPMSHHGPLHIPVLTRLDRRSVSGTAILEGRTIHVADVLATDDYPWSKELSQENRQRAMLAAPLMRDGKAFGVIIMRRAEPQPFTDRQVQLIETFADQAVIAIENVRLFNETKEALEQQTATAEVLKVISSSQTDIKPVFDAIGRRAVQLGEAEAATAFLYDGGKLHFMTSHGHPDEWVEWLQSHSPFTPDDDRLSGQVVQRGAPVTMQLDEERDEPAGRWQFRSGLGVPMLRDGETIGVLNVWWRLKPEIPQKYVSLLQTFADQAVIAIENVRLFKEIQEKSRQLELANKHKSEFLANMSHELRTPLNAIIGFSDVMLSGMAGPVPEKQKEFTTDIRDSGKHLLGLINDILDLSKIEAGRMELDVATFDVPGAMDNAMTLVRGRAERHAINLESRIAPEVTTYEGDERKFKQIMLNLLTNAVKFTPEGGTVTMSAEKLNGSYVFSVKDTGIGIAPEDHQKVFEEFRQVGTDYARKAEGTGLGLTLTRKLVELHGGHIDVESALGRGSTFTFNLPLGAP